MNQHDHSIAWMIAGGRRANEERDRAFLHAVAEARAGVAGPGLVARVRARFERRQTDAVAACCPMPA